MCPRENNRSHPLSFKGLACLSIFVNFCFFAQTRVTASQWGLMFTVSLHWPVKKKIIKNLSAEHWPSLCAARHFLFQMTALFHRCSQEMFDWKCSVWLKSPGPVTRLVSNTGTLCSLIDFAVEKNYRIAGLLGSEVLRCHIHAQIANSRL